MTAAVIGLLLPVAATYVALRALRLRTARDSPLVTLAVAICGGLGLASVVTFWSAVFGLTIGSRFAMIDAGAWVAAGASAWWAGRRAGDDGGTGAAPVPPLAAADWVVRGVFCVVATIAVATVVAHYVASPHGDWDAWAIWNLKARFIVREPNPWEAMLAVPWSQPSHPFLVSLSVARLWAYAGGEPTVVPAMLGSVWGIGIVAAVMGALDTRRKRAWIAGAVLIAPGTFTRLVAAQTSDLAVGLFLVTSLVMLRSALTRDWGSERVNGSLLLAGALGSLAAWTKNEGFLFLGIATLLVVGLTPRRRWVRDLAVWTASAVPVGATVVWFKLFLAPVAPAYMSESEMSLVERLLDPVRRELVNTAIGWRWLEWGTGMATGVLPVVIAAAVWAVFTPGGRSARPLLATVCAMFMAYYAVWILSPLDTAWLVSTTFERLFIHLWPALVVTAFSAGAMSPAPRAPVAVAADPRG